MPVRWVIWLISSFIACSSSFLQSAMALRYAAPDEAFETHESTTRHILCQPLRSCVQKSHTPSANGWRARLWRRAFRRLHAALADLLAQGAFALDTEVVIEGEEGGNQHLRACQQRPPVDDEKEPDARDHQQHGSGGYRHSEQEQKRPDEAVLLVIAGIGFFFVVNWWALLASPQMLIAAFFALYYYFSIQRERALRQQISQGRMQTPERPPPEPGAPAVG